MELLTFMRGFAAKAKIVQPAALAVCGPIAACAAQTAAGMAPGWGWLLSNAAAPAVEITASLAVHGDSSLAEMQYQHQMRCVRVWAVPALAFAAGVALQCSAGATFPSSPDISLLAVLRHVSAAAMALALAGTPWLPLVTHSTAACRGAVQLLTA